MPPGPDLVALPLNCPHCGQRLRYLRARTPEGETVADRAASDETTLFIYHCATHGSYRLGPNVPLKPGD